MTARRATKGYHYKTKTPEKRLHERLRSKYRLDDAAAAIVTRAIEAGAATCPICLRAGRQMHIDHDHACCPGYSSCGECARGYICRNCNQGLGQFGDDTDVLERAIAYLREPPFQAAG